MSKKQKCAGSELHLSKWIELAKEKRDAERISSHAETKLKVGCPEGGTRQAVVPEAKRAACEAGIDPVLNLSSTGPDFPWRAFI
jgi:hypothetical protein